MDPEDDLKYGDSPQNPVGMRAQVGGGLAIFIGVVLFVFYPHVAADAPINLHQMAGLFIVTPCVNSISPVSALCLFAQFVAPPLS